MQATRGCRKSYSLIILGVPALICCSAASGMLGRPHVLGRIVVEVETYVRVSPALLIARRESNAGPRMCRPSSVTVMALFEAWQEHEKIAFQGISPSRYLFWTTKLIDHARLESEVAPVRTYGSQPCRRGVKTLDALNLMLVWIDCESVGRKRVP